MVKFSDRTAQQAYGITKASVSTKSNGNVQLKVWAQGLDLRGAIGTHVDFRFDFAETTFLGSTGCTVKTSGSFTNLTCRDN